MSKAAVLDASALLCLLNGEQGSERVLKALPTALIGAANLAEVVSKLRERGLSVDEVEDVLGGLRLDVRPLTPAQAYAIGHLRPATRSHGLSLGDRACLALAAELGMPALTADQAWGELKVGVSIELVRDPKIV